MKSATHSSARFRSGELVSRRYRVLRMIGNGGMGAVYEAVDERLGSRVALKESFASEPELRSQFEREARLLARLKHSALPKVTDYFIEDDHAFLVMEYIEGDSLAEVVTSQAPLPAQQVIAWADQVLDVLIYLHGTDRRIVHRDIKPHNLRVTSSGVISLLDFGLAKVTPASSETEARSVHGYTRWYSPIEQIEDSGTNECSDIYALGATLYHLLTGVRPEDSARRAREMAQIGVDCLQRADWIVPAVGEDLARVIQRSMAVRSDQRYQTAEQFREALRQLGRVANTTADIPPAVSASPQRRAIGPRRRFARLTVAAAILIFGVTLAGQLVKKHADAERPSIQASAINDLSSAESPPKKVTATVPRIKSAQASAPAAVSPIANRSCDDKPEVLPVAKPKQNPRETRTIVPSAEPQKIVRSAGTRTAATAAKSKPSVTPARDLDAPRDAPRVFRAPDGTEVVKYKDGHIRVLSGSDRGGQR
jgi:serine/threonine protein kinase